MVDALEGDAEKVSLFVRWATWIRLTIIGLFGILYAWDLFEAISNLFGKVDELAQRNRLNALLELPPIDTPWFLLISNLVLPVLVFVLAVALTRKRNLGVLVMVFLAGLAAIAALSLTFTVFVLRIT